VQRLDEHFRQLESLSAVRHAMQTILPGLEDRVKALERKAAV
jgi:hypothetical protein